MNSGYVVLFGILNEPAGKCPAKLAGEYFGQFCITIRMTRILRLYQVI